MSFFVPKVREAKRNGSEIHYSDLFKVCEHFFGAPRNRGASHNIFKTPWVGDPRINIQNDKGKSKPYQVRRVLAAIARLAELQAAKAAAAKEPKKPKK
jgi:hypothetical protein